MVVTVVPLKAKSFPASLPIASVPPLAPPHAYSLKVIVVPDRTFCKAGVPDKSIWDIAFPLLSVPV